LGVELGLEESRASVLHDLVELLEELVASRGVALLVKLSAYLGEHL
jgi:hypothetical protein